MTLKTTLNFQQDDSVVISKRTNAGKRAHALIASATDYSAVIGKGDYGWEDSIRFTMSEDTVSAVEALVRQYLLVMNPMTKHAQPVPCPFYVFTDLLWSVRRGSITEARVLRFTVVDDDVDVVDLGVISSFRNDYPYPNMTHDFYEGNITGTLEARLRNKREADEAKRTREATIVHLKATQTLTDVETYKISFAQRFVDNFVNEVEVREGAWFDSTLRTYRDHMVALVTKRLTEFFLRIVGQTTLEVQSPQGDGWNDSKVHHVIGVDEAFGIAVAWLAREAHGVSDPTRDFMGDAIAKFMSILRSY